jgi:ankyrin repeat protein
VNAQDNRDRTALHLAAIKENILVFNLLKGVVNGNIRDHQGKTAKNLR